jgi:hypothetical protein
MIDKNNELIHTASQMNIFKTKDDRNVCKEKEAATKILSHEDDILQ